MQRQPENNDQQQKPRRAHNPHQHEQNQQDNIQQLMQNRRRQKTLSSISNFVPLHILLNQPRGISFSLTVPKSFTIEQLARQIEAEYAYMVEREFGHSRYPVIECGALFDHIELPPRRKGTGRTIDENGSGSQDYEDEEDEEDEEEHVDERDEAESRGVQLRFSDRVEDVLERDSTVHFVNIDQGLAMGRKMSLTNLTAMAVVSSQDSLHHPTDSAGPSSPPPSSSMSHISPPISSNSLSLLQLPHPQLPQQQQGQGPQRLSSPISFLNESDVLSVHSSVLATAASTPCQSPHSIGNGESDVGAGSARELSPSSISTQQQPLSAVRYESSSSRGEGRRPSASKESNSATTAPDALDSASGTQINAAGKDTPLASPYVSSNSLSSSFRGADHSPQAETINTVAATNADGAPTAATTPTTIATTTTTFSSSSSSSFRPRSRATDLLLNLEASSNDVRFQEILHNTIALDLFRQFCFQEYSIENLLFWMDVELFAKPNLEMQRADRLKHKIMQKRLEKQQRAYRQDGKRSRNNSSNKEAYIMDEKQSPKSDRVREEKYDLDEEELSKLRREVDEEDAEFAVQHARYIYLTYIDTYAPLQVNLSDESRTDIPWPILDPNDPKEISDSRNHSRNNSGGSNKSGKKSSKSGSRMDEVIGWPLDRHMFDGAQEHTYQLMKGHTLVRFEDSELWKSAQRMMHDKPGEYEKAIVQGPLHSHYCPDSSVILSTVARSRSRHPTAKLQTLYNWNNSTTDLDRSRDKEEALAKTMSQYFGPIPQSIRHPGRVILGLGPRHHDDDDLYDEDEFDDFDTFEEHVHGNSGLQLNAMTEGKRSSGSSIAGGIGSGFRKNRFTKRLSGGRNNKGQHHSNASDEMVQGDMYDDAYSLDHDLSHEGVDTVANGKRTTRWMVAGYFNDQVRLTAAQRKRLLRRNNKLTKFFGSRVDGTLRPVEETEDGGFIVPPSSHSLAAAGDGSLAAVGPGGAPMLGSPLAYALSSSTIHDMDKKGRPKKNKSKRDSGNGHEVLFHFPSATKSAGSRSMSILQKFKRSSGEYYDSNNNSRKSSSQDDIGTSSGNSRHFRSATSVDGLPAGRRILAAHPHPLWSGSLSDHEVDSPAGYERRRQLSILSIMGNSLNNNSTSPHSPHPSGLTPTTPTGSGLEFYASPRGLDQDGILPPNRPSQTAGAGSLDRHVMYTRRKKADKLSTFFGAQLTAQELSSQLRMDDDFGLTSSTSQTTTAQQQDQEKEKKKKGDQLQRSLSESDKHKVKPAVMDPTVLSVNHLSHRDRTLLWKRNKKLRGILGESLQEKEVALSLTIPVLMGSSTRLRNSMSSSRRVASPSLKKKRSAGSLHVKQVSNETLTRDSDDEEDEDVGGEDDSEEYEDLNSSSNLVRHKTGKGGSKSRSRRASTTNSAGARPRRSSVASNASSVYRRHPHHNGRSGRGSISELTRAMSIQSLDSFMTIDTALGEDLDEDLRETEEELGIPRRAHRRRTSSIRPHGYSHISPRYRQIHATENCSFGLSGDGATTAAAEALTRFNRKKKMDKIQQFLGDRVPEQDLWMGTVGREKTQEMLDRNLLSPTSTTAFSLDGVNAVSVVGTGGAGLTRSATGSKLTPKFKRATFPGRGKTTSGNALKSDDLANEKENEKGTSIASEKSSKKTRLGPVVVTTGSRTSGTVRMERSLSDPPRLEDGAGNGLGIQSPSAHQHPYQWHTTVSRLRQQLATPALAPAPGTTTAAAAGGYSTRVSESSTSPPMSPPTSFSASSIASPRVSLSSNHTNNTGNIPAAADVSSSHFFPTSAPGYMTVLHDEEGDDSALDADDNDDESAQILPRLRAMSGKDQELFLKRAEKLEKLFGHFPPSALLHRSLTTASASSATSDATTKDEHEGKTRSSEGEEMVSITSGGTSMVQLAAFLASTTTSDAQEPSASSPSFSRTKKEEDKKWTNEMMEALAEVERSSCSSFSTEDGAVVESLRLSSPV